MRFKLVEKFENDIWYHASPNKFSTFKSNWQGIHFADSEEGALDVLKNRQIVNNTFYLYKVNLDIHNPLYIDYDPMSWDGITIAKALYAKINNSTVEGATGENDVDGNNYKTDLSPNLIHFDISKLNQGLETIIKNYAQLDVTKNYPDRVKGKIFTDMIKIIEHCGYDSIIYPLAEDVDGHVHAIIVWDNTKIEILDMKKVN